MSDSCSVRNDTFESAASPDLPQTDSISNDRFAWDRMHPIGIVNKPIDAQDQHARRLIIFELCKQHMLGTIQACEMLENPFPHFMIRGFLPEEVYRAMLNLLPAREHYSSFEYGDKAPEGPGTRWRFDLSDRATAKLAPAAQALWLGVRDALGCLELKRAVFEKLAVGIAHRNSISPSEAIDLPGFPLPALFREETGYCIKPHPDTRKKIVTMQIALPADDTQEHLGTQFYRRSLSPMSLLREPRGFETVKTSPFVRNAAYAFVVINKIGKKSWHGRTTLASTSGVRNSILNIWHMKPEYGHPDVVREHYQSSRP